MSSPSSPRRPSRSSNDFEVTQNGESGASSRIQGVLGVCLDGNDGHQRITKGDDFVVMGGSGTTHERMQELVLRMKSTLNARGKQFADLSRDEFEDLAHDSMP